jgi:hypothetical protein
MTATTAIGSGALAALAAGTDNVAVGRQAGNGVTSGGSNVTIGAGAAPTLTTGGSNIIIGAGADVPTASTSSYLNIGGAIFGSMASGGALSLFETPASGDNTNKIATTAFVQNAVSGGGGGGGAVPYLQIGGLIISSIAGTHTTASFNISAGGCADLTGAAYLSVSSTLSWKASNGNAINGTDASSSTLANSTTYHVFVCKGASGTGSFVSASLTPTFPTGYNTYSRRIGSFTTTSAGAPVPYTSIETYGGATRNYLTTQVLDQGAAAVTTSARTLYTLGSIPTGVKMRPIGRWLSYGAATSQFIVTSPDETDVAPASYTSPGTVPGWDSSINATTGVSAMFNWDLTTNTSSQIGGRGGSTSASFSATTRGWDDLRRS